MGENQRSTCEVEVNYTNLFKSFNSFFSFLICMIWNDLWDLLSLASRTVTVGSARSALLFLVAYGEKSYKSVQIFQIFFYPHFIVPSNSWHFFKVAVWSLFRITIGFPFGRRPLVPDIHCVGIANPDEHCEHYSVYGFAEYLHCSSLFLFYSKKNCSFL